MANNKSTFHGLFRRARISLFTLGEILVTIAYDALQMSIHFTLAGNVPDSLYLYRTAELHLLGVCISCNSIIARRSNIGDEDDGGGDNSFC